jgi:capsid protein
VIIPGFCERVWGWFLEAAAIRGYTTAGVSMEWTTPRKILVDPAREIPAAITAARATLTSPQEVMRELGYDPAQVLREWQAFAGQLDELGLVSEIDPRHTTSQGARVTDPTDTLPPDATPAGRAAPLRNGHDPA